MLSRWPIRVKLLMALVILSAIVSTLALSGFWGLYGYRQLAMTVSDRAAELPLNSRLTRNADAMRDACQAIRSGRKTDSLIASAWGMEYQSERFHDSMAVYRRTLGQYRQRLQEPEEYSGGLADSRAQLEVLAELGRHLDEIDTPGRADLLRLGDAELASLEDQLHLLSAQTERLSRLLQERMAGFRNQVRGQYRTMIALAWSSLVAAILLLGTLLWLFRKLVVKPFRILLAGSRRVAKGDLDYRIDLGTGDEFAELAAATNSMTDRFQKAYDELEAVCRDLDKEVRERTREAVQREQLASVGFLAAGVAHEINNPLASIAWSAEALESRMHELLHSGEGDEAAACSLTPDQLEALRTNLRRIQEEAFRCKGITERLLDFSRLGDVRRSTTDLTDLVNDVVAMVSTLGQYRCKTIRFHATEPVFADVNPQQIKQVVLNLMTNALESVDKDGAVDVDVQRHGDNARIVVTDNGCGMTEEVRRHLFEPFFTRRRDGRGTGLGLSITYRIVNQHGGQLTAHSDGPQCGSRLDVILPTKATSDVELERKTAA